MTQDGSKKRTILAGKWNIADVFSKNVTYYHTYREYIALHGLARYSKTMEKPDRYVALVSR